MKEVILENINLSLLDENSNVRLKSRDDDVILVDQSVDDILNIVKLNFDIVNNFYKKRVSQESDAKFDFTEINRISLTIVLHYLYLYNSWRITYRKKEYQNLIFNEQDFGKPSTSDIIMIFCQKNYPRDWEERSSILLGMKPEELKSYYKEREKFYTK